MTEISRLVPLDRLGGGWFAIEVTPSAGELAALAERLLVPSIPTMRCRFRLRRDIADATVVLAEGELAAEVEQVCVVTLEPFIAAVGEAFRLRFIPPGREPADEDPESDDELPYEDGAIDVGEAAAQQLALTLDPFPRGPGAILPELDEPAPENAFAALAGRRRV